MNICMNYKNVISEKIGIIMIIMIMIIMIMIYDYDYNYERSVLEDKGVL